MPGTNPHFSVVQAWYVAALALVSVLLVAIMAGSGLTIVRTPEVLATVLLALVGIIAESNRGHCRGFGAISLTTIATTTAIPLTGVYGALVVGLCSTLLLVSSDGLTARLFTSISVVVCVVSEGFAYSFVGGVSPLARDIGLQALLRNVLLPIVVAVAVSFVASMACLAGMTALGDGQRRWLTLRENVRSSWSVYPGYAVTSFVFVCLWVPAKLGPLSIFPILVPLMLAQWTTSVRDREHQSHLRTVETLVAAGQASQPMLRGRSGWVDMVSREIGLELQLSSECLQSLQYAALLHDIGLVAPAAHRPGEFLNAGEVEWIRAHPQQSVLMLQGVDFLAESVEAIGHHHERWDGLGYPTGLDGVKIPKLARVLAVADTYCALVAAEADSLDCETSQTAARALATVRSLAGKQLDPEVVEAFARANARVVRALSESISREAPLPVVGVDPHLPWVSDLFAGQR